MAVAGRAALEVARETVATVTAVATVAGARAVKLEAVRWVEATALTMAVVARAATMVEVAGAPCMGRQEAAVAAAQKVARR